jgi:hypothetical protein
MGKVMRSWMVTVMVGTTCAACAVDTRVVVSGVEVELCEDFVCGGNSPTIADGVVFGELHPGGVPNAQGVRLVDAVHVDPATGTVDPVAIRVERAELIATSRATAAVYRGIGLVGTRITVTSPLVRDPVELRIDEVRPESLHFWANDLARPGITPPEGLSTDERQLVTYYRITVTATQAPLCRQPTPLDQDWSAAEYSAVVYEGDRYDAKLKQVKDDEGSPWFNIACAGSAPAKMHLMRRTNAGSFDPGGLRWYATPVDERQAMLKMFTADYCGTGHAFTSDGQPLIWIDARHWYDESRLIGRSRRFKVEALWTANGAACLGEPRLFTREDIRAVCPWLRDCEDADIAGWEARFPVISETPTSP